MEDRVLFLVSVVVFFIFVSIGFAEPEADKKALLDFLSGITHGRALNWREDTSVCGSWRGAVCDPERSHVVELRLPGMGFNGRVPPHTLSRISGLRVLSLRSNSLSGPFPADFSNLAALTRLHLQLNGFSGRLPSDFSAWKNLTVLDLSNNDFDGSIPASISYLTHLVSLNLSNNSLSGRIPEFLPPSLQFLNLSSNHFHGFIPRSLLRFLQSSFLGNQLSPFLSESPSPSPSPSSHSFKRKISESALLGIIAGGSALTFVASAVLLLLYFSAKKNGVASPRKEVKDHDLLEKIDAVNEEENNRLVFFEGCGSEFDLEDLLRASAEVLGKGTYGISYKAVLEDATMVVVKRLKDVSVGRKEFEQQMEVVGKIRHENVVGLNAYYYSKNEKLVVYDYYNQGSVHSMLHGRRGEGRTELDWETRLRTALGAARGIAHIHLEQSGKLVHGNIKSSNVFLNHRRYGCLSDLGLATMSSPAAPRTSRIAGYRAPEVTDARKSSHASDVYGFGVLALELLTGKSPVQIGGNGNEVVHLVRWVHSVLREEWTAEVFDAQLLRCPYIEEELVEMLRVAMACVARMPEQRPRTVDVVEMVEDVRRLSCARRPSEEMRGSPQGRSSPET